MKYILILAVMLYSCSVTRPAPAVKTWTVVSVRDREFTARYGRIFARFIPVDSVWVGKKIQVSTGK